MWPKAVRFMQPSADEMAHRRQECRGMSLTRGAGPACTIAAVLRAISDNSESEIGLAVELRQSPESDGNSADPGET